MVTRSSLILAFALAFTFFIVAPPFLGIPFGAYPSMHWADVLDLITPLVLIPLYWLLFSDSGRIRRGLRLVLAFLVLAALWTEGQGMHLSANSISNLFGPGATAAHSLIHFYDEVLSHYLWHAGIIGLSIVLALAPLEGGLVLAPMKWAVRSVSAILYGFTYFAAVDEGGTVPMGLPAAILILVALLLARRRQLRTHNLVAFFFLGYCVAVLLFAVWFVMTGGFPEPSALGWF
jgi:hypothetical protein